MSVERRWEHLGQSHPVSLMMTLTLWPVCLCCPSARIAGWVTPTLPGASLTPLGPSPAWHCSSSHALGSLFLSLPLVPGLEQLP